MVGALIKINPLVLLFGAYPIDTVTLKITNDFIFQNAKVARGPCPSCEAQEHIYFGDILDVEGYGDASQVKCKTCKQSFQIQRKSLRASALSK